MKRVPIVAGLLLLAACETAPLQPDNPAFRVTPSAGWTQMPRRSHLELTVDGPRLQAIKVAMVDPNEYFKALERKVDDSLLPSELAELHIALAKRQHGDKSPVEVVANDLAEISAEPGFKVHFRWRNTEGLRYESIVYGLLHGGKYYVLMYSAPTLHYFARDLPAFDAFVQTFHLKRAESKT